MSSHHAPGGPAAPSPGDALPGRDGPQGRTVVIKLGGHAMVDEDLTAAFARDVVALHRAGLRPVVVHGGGPQIDAELARRGLEREFRAGLRVTSPAAMEVVRMVLAGRVQRELVGLINRSGPLAVGMTGEDADTLVAVRHVPRVDGEPVDVGRVGDITAVDTGALESLLADGRIPVVSPVARSAEDGQVYNVNADTAAAALATALGADALVVLTDVAGLYADWPHSEEVIPRLTAVELEALLPELSDGMVPKMAGCLRAVQGGVGEVRVIDGRVPHAVLDAFTDGRAGTVIVPGPAGLSLVPPYEEPWAPESAHPAPDGLIRLRFADARELARAGAAFGAASGPGLGDAWSEPGSLILQIPADASPATLRAVLAVLDAASVTSESVTVHTNELDDLFAALTGAP